MAGAAGLGLFHVSHGELGFALQVEYGIVADAAVVVVFFKVEVVAEDYGFSILEGEGDVFSLLCQRDCR